MLELHSNTPFIAGFVGWYDPTARDAADALDAFANASALKGFRPVRPDNASIAWLADPAAQSGLDLLSARGLALDLLVHNPDEAPLAMAIVARHPDVTIVIDLCAKPDIAGRRFEPWASDIAALAKHPNAVCKLSGLLSRARPGARLRNIRDCARHVVDCFGPDRTLWASDWPPLRLAAEYETWWRISQDLLIEHTEEDRRQVLAGTAQRVYRL